LADEVLGEDCVFFVSVRWWLNCAGFGVGFGRPIPRDELSKRWSLMYDTFRKPYVVVNDCASLRRRFAIRVEFEVGCSGAAA